jgi:deoxyribose-phosphate aldolase
LKAEELAKMIDHSLLRANATQSQIQQLCDEAIDHGFASVTVNPSWTTYCAKRLKGSSVSVNPTVGFPLGSSTARIKVEETHDAVKNGAAEVDMVINVGALKSGFPDFVEKEISAVVKAAKGLPVKVILEVGLLTDDEKLLVCGMSCRSGAAFVKTSTGFGPEGASVRDVALLKQAVGNMCKVKAAGGIRSYRDAIRLIEAGAARLGTSAGIKILSEIPH